MQKYNTGLKRGLVPDYVFWVQKPTFNFSIHLNLKIPL